MQVDSAGCELSLPGIETNGESTPSRAGALSATGCCRGHAPAAARGCPPSADPPLPTGSSESSFGSYRVGVHYVQGLQKIQDLMLRFGQGQGADARRCQHVGCEVFIMPVSNLQDLGIWQSNPVTADDDDALYLRASRGPSHRAVSATVGPSRQHSSTTWRPRELAQGQGV